MAEINGVSVPFLPIVNNTDFASKSQAQVKESFDSIFKQELDKVKFSSHAMKRLESRNIQLSDQDLNRIQDAVTKAESKGSKDSLVLMDNTAFIVNIPNKTVVTAMEVAGSNDNVFTNIDSVVFAI